MGGQTDRRMGGWLAGGMNEWTTQVRQKPREVLSKNGDHTKVDVHADNICW